MERFIILKKLKELISIGYKFNTNSDSEIIPNALAQELNV